MDWKKYQEGVLETENTDMNPILGQLSYHKVIRLLHAAMGLCTESAEFLDQMKKHIFYQKDLDEINLIEELGDLQWYTMLALHLLGVDLEEVWRRNRAKLLEKRYKNGFSKEAAINRDLEAEREVLEDLDQIDIGEGVKDIKVYQDIVWPDGEDLEYEMKPQLEADMYYSEYDEEDNE